MSDGEGDGVVVLEVVGWETESRAEAGWKSGLRLDAGVGGWCKDGG